MLVPLRSTLQALQYVVQGRADWLVRKAANRKLPLGDRRRQPRLQTADDLRRTAGAIGRCVHADETAGEITAEFAALLLVSATGHRIPADTMLAAMAEQPESAWPALDELVALRLLPPSQ